MPVPLNNKISRLTALKNGTDTLESYTYLGLGTVVKRGRTGSAPVVQYAYSNDFTNNHSRLVSVTYPTTSRVVTHNYTGLDNTVSRLTALKEGANTLESYTYLGLGTVVQRVRPWPAVDLTYVEHPQDPSCTPLICDAGDRYRGLDRFGRVVDQRWLRGGNTHTDRFGYGYDRNSNRLYRENLFSNSPAHVSRNFSDLYHANGADQGYDDLNQLKEFRRGPLSDSNGDLIPDTVLAATRSQSWGLDVMGNWDSVTTELPPAQSRTHNKQNQVLTVSGAASSPDYDPNGNTKRDETNKAFAYDAWNRLVQVNEGATAVYAYDALGRRVTETSGSPAVTHDLYYSGAWQLLEDRVSGEDPLQYVWSPVYVDALVVRYRGSQRLWVQQDANWNVTAIVDALGFVRERYVYDPYGPFGLLHGEFGTLDPDWSPRTGSLFGWVHLHQGGRYDAASGLYQFRHRDYSPTLGRWMQQDPIGFRAGDMNLYRYVANNSVNSLDSAGLQSLKIREGTLTATAGPETANEQRFPGVRIALTGPNALQLLKDKRFKVKQYMQLEIWGTYACPSKDAQGNPCHDYFDYAVNPRTNLDPRGQQPHGHPHVSGTPLEPRFYPDPGPKDDFSPGPYFEDPKQKDTIVYTDNPNAAYLLFPQATAPRTMNINGKPSALASVSLVQRFVTYVHCGQEVRATVHWTSTARGPLGGPAKFPPTTGIIQVYPGKVDLKKVLELVLPGYQLPVLY